MYNLRIIYKKKLSQSVKTVVLAPCVASFLLQHREAYRAVTQKRGKRGDSWN